MTSIQFMVNAPFFPARRRSPRRRLREGRRVHDDAALVAAFALRAQGDDRVSGNGIADRIRTVRTIVGGTTPHGELMKINPLGKIPTLELEDGTVIYDSPVIIEYLDTLHTGPKLYPSAWPERLTALRRHALGQGMLDSALPLLGEGFRPAERQSEPHKALWRAKLRASVDALGTGGRGAGRQRLHHRPSRDRRRAGVSGFPLRRHGMARRASQDWRRGSDSSMPGHQCRRTRSSTIVKSSARSSTRALRPDCHRKRSGRCS